MVKVSRNTPFQGSELNLRNNDPTVFKFINAICDHDIGKTCLRFTEGRLFIAFGARSRRGSTDEERP